MRKSVLTVAVLASIATPALGQALVEMQHGIADARFVSPYSTVQRAKVAQRTLHLPSRPALGVALSLTPDAPYAPDGSRLSFWKPSFVIGTANGGEAGINFWEKYQQGHINVAFTPRIASPVLLDCRVLSRGSVAYKIYAENESVPSAQGRAALHDGHFLLSVPAAKTENPISVELWPATDTQVVGFFGCELSAMKEQRRLR